MRSWMWNTLNISPDFSFMRNGIVQSGASMWHVWRVKAYSFHLVHLGFRGRERAPMGGGSAKKKMSKERGQQWPGSLRATLRRA